MNAVAPYLQRDSHLEQRIDELVRHEFLDGGAIAGVSVAVVRDGAAILVKGYGLADAVAQTPVVGDRTLFRTGSVSKVLTATAVMQLVERKLLDLDADVNAYLDFKIPYTFPDPVTLKNLLTHTAGFEECQLGWMFSRDASGLRPLGGHLARHIPRRMRPPVRDFSDGTTAGYSNWGMALAGHIVALKAQMPFDDYVEQHICAPLGMTRSTFREPLPAGWDAQLAKGHVYREAKGATPAHLEPQPFEYLHNIGPAGSFTTNAGDMARFMIAQLNGGVCDGRRILDADSVKLMHSRILSPHGAVNGAGLAFYEQRMNGQRVLCHGGKPMHGEASLVLLPDVGIGLFVTANTAKDISRRMRQFLRDFMDDHFPDEPSRERAFAGTAKQRAGVYLAVPGPDTKNEKVRLLLDPHSEIRVKATGDKQLQVTNLGWDAQWTEVEAGVFRAAGDIGQDRIAFIDDAQRRAGHIVGPTPAMPVRKAAWHERPSVHRVLLAVCGIGFVAALAGALWQLFANESRDVTLALRALVAATAACGLAGAGLVAFTFMRGPNVIAAGYPASMRVGLTLILLAVPLVLAVCGLAVAAWPLGFVPIAERSAWTVFALLALAFLWSMHHWNLIGYKYA